MSEKKISSLEKIGYLKTLPKDADINDYESLLITQKDGKIITLYILASERKEFENIIAKHNKKKGEDTKKKADSDGDGWETDSQEEEKSKSKSEKTEVKEVHIEGNE